MARQPKTNRNRPEGHPKSMLSKEEQRQALAVLDLLRVHCDKRARMSSTGTIHYRRPIWNSDHTEVMRQEYRSMQLNQVQRIFREMYGDPALRWNTSQEFKDRAAADRDKAMSRQAKRDGVHHKTDGGHYIRARKHRSRRSYHGTQG